MMSIAELDYSITTLTDGKSAIENSYLRRQSKLKCLVSNKVSRTGRRVTAKPSSSYGHMI